MDESVMERLIESLDRLNQSVIALIEDNNDSEESITDMSGKLINAKLSSNS